MLFIMVDDIPSIGQILEVRNEEVTSIESPKSNGINVALTPNPATQTLYIELPETVLQFHFQIYDAFGRMVLVGSNQHQIDIQELSAGVFFFVLSDGKNTATRKFLKM